MMVDKLFCCSQVPVYTVRELCVSGMRLTAKHFSENYVQLGPHLVVVRIPADSTPVDM